MDERGPWTGHLTKLQQTPVVTIERVDRQRAAVSGVFAITVDAEWRDRPSVETLEAAIADAIRDVLQRHTRPES